MNVCDPNTSYENIKKRVERNVGRPLNLSRKQICDLYTNIQQERLLLPPLVMSTDKTYMIDKKSPLTQRNYEVLFDKSSKKSQLKRIATKAGALTNSKDTKDQIKTAIFSKLRTLGVREPIKLGRVRAAAPTKEAPSVVNSATSVSAINNRNNATSAIRNNSVNAINNRNNSATNNRNNSAINNRNNTINSVNSVNSVNAVNNRNNSVNAIRNNSINNRKTVFKRNFVPEFIKKKKNKNYAPVPVAERVSVNAGQPVFRAMEAPRPTITRNNAPEVPIPAPTVQRVLPRIASTKAAEARAVKAKVAQRQELQKHLNSLKNLSVENVDEYINRLASERSSLQDIKKEAATQNERYKKRKDEIRQKLKNFQSEMTLTQKSVYNARLNAIPRGKTRSYLNTIEADLLKDMNASNLLRKKSQIRKEFMNVASNKEAVKTKYQEIANKYSGRNREVLNKVYNSLLNVRPKLPTNANTLTKMQVIRMLNRDTRRRNEENVSRKIQELTKQLNNAARANKQTQFNNIASQISKAQSKRVAFLNQELSKLKNLSQRVSNSKEQVELQNEIEKVEQVVSTARTAESRQQSEVTQIQQRATKRRRMETNNSAIIEEAEVSSAANAKAAAANAAEKRRRNEAAAAEKRRRNEAAAANAAEKRRRNEANAAEKRQRNEANAQRRRNEANAAEKRQRNEANAAEKRRRNEAAAANAKAAANAAAKATENAQRRRNEAAAARAAAAEAAAEIERERAELEALKRQAKTEANTEKWEQKQRELEQKEKLRLKAKEREQNLALKAREAAIAEKAAKREQRKAEEANRRERANAKEQQRKAEEAAKREQRKAEEANRRERANAKEQQRKAEEAAKREQRKAEEANRRERANAKEQQRKAEEANRRERANAKRRELQKLANNAGVSVSYVTQYANRVPGEVNLNSLKNKADKDREVAKLQGKKNVSFIAPQQYNAILNTAKKQRFVANKRNLGVSMQYLNTYIRATSGVNSVDDIDAADFVNKFKMDKNLMQKEAVRVGPVSKMGQVKGMLRRAAKGVEYVPKNTYDNRMKKALAVAENKERYDASIKAGKTFALAAKQGGADTEYLKAYMQAKEYTNLNQLNANAFRKKVMEDKKLLAEEAAIAGKRRMFQKVSFITNDAYAERAKKVETAKKERLLLKNIPKAFLNQYREKTGKSINNATTELKNIYAKALELSQLSGQPVSYPENMSALNTNLTRLRKQRNILQKYNISKNFLNAHFKKTGTTIDTVNENTLKTALNKARELSNFLKTPIKYPDDKINNNLAVARKQRQENTDEKRFLEIIKQNIKNANVEKFIKNKGITAEQIIKNKSLFNKLKSENVRQSLLKQKVPEEIINKYSGKNLTKDDFQKVLNYYKRVQISEQQEKGAAQKLEKEEAERRKISEQREKGAAQKLEKTRTALKKRAAKVGLSNINVSDVNAARERIEEAERRKISEQREKGATQKLEKTRAALRKRAVKVGLSNINVSDVNAARERIEEAERRKISEQREKGAAQKLEKERVALKKRAAKAGLSNINVSDVNAARERVKKAENIQADAKKRGVRVNSSFIKSALNMNNVKLQESFIKKRLQSMGVNNAWIEAYKKDRKVNTLKNDVIATAQRQLTMLKNGGGGKLEYLTMIPKMKKMDDLYMKPFLNKIMKNYNITEKDAQFAIREFLPKKDNTMTLRDPAVKRNVEAKLAQKFKSKREFLRAKKTAKDTIEKMEQSKLNSGNKKKFTNQLNKATNKTQVKTILAEAQRRYNSGAVKQVKRRILKVEEVDTAEEERDIPFGPQNSQVRRLRFRLGEAVRGITEGVGGASKQTPLTLPAPTQNMRKVLKNQAKARRALPAPKRNQATARPALPAPQQNMRKALKNQAKARPALPAPKKNDTFVNARDRFNQNNTFVNARQSFKPQQSLKRKAENTGRSTKKPKAKTSNSEVLRTFLRNGAITPGFVNQKRAVYEARIAAAAEKARAEKARANRKPKLRTSS
jgi:hypothetical protein